MTSLYLQTETNVLCTITAWTGVWTPRAHTTVSAMRVTSWQTTTTAVLVSYQNALVLICQLLHFLPVVSHFYFLKGRKFQNITEDFFFFLKCKKWDENRFSDPMLTYREILHGFHLYKFLKVSVSHTLCQHVFHSVNLFTVCSSLFEIWPPPWSFISLWPLRMSTTCRLSLSAKL